MTRISGDLFRGIQLRIKRFNLPRWKRVKIDIDHIASGHIYGGSRVSPRKDLFPEYMTKGDVEKAVRDAYRHGERVRTQDDRILVRGQDSVSRLTIEMWVNVKTRTLETAYPIWE